MRRASMRTFLPIPNAGFLFQNAQFRSNWEEKLAYLKKNSNFAGKIVGLYIAHKCIDSAFF